MDVVDKAAGTLQAELRRELDRALADAPGVTTTHLGVSVFGISMRLDFSVAGLSPSLHRVDVRHEGRMHYEMNGEDTLREEGRAAIARVADLQRPRALEAARLALDARPHARALTHLSVDVALPELLGTNGIGTRGVVLEALRRAHATTSRYDGGAKLKASGVVIEERVPADDDGAAIRLVAPNVKLRDADGRHKATLRGFELQLEAPHLPDAVLAGAIGRPLRDLVSLHPRLDDRTIRKVENRTRKARPGVIVGIDMNVEPIDDLAPMAA